jgi:hypothetical protein
MFTSSFDTLRRLLGAACRGVHPTRFASSRSGDRRVAGADLIYRLKAWPQLPEAGRTAEIYRMLSVMSNRPVNRQWILTRTRMEPQQLEGLLRRWVAEGAIEVIDPARFAGREALQA